MPTGIPTPGRSAADDALETLRAAAAGVAEIGDVDGPGDAAERSSTRTAGDASGDVAERSSTRTAGGAAERSLTRTAGDAAERSSTRTAGRGPSDDRGFDAAEHARRFEELHEALAAVLDELDRS